MSNKTITMLQIRRILQLKKQGKSNREVAQDLHISRITANSYVRRICDQPRSFDELLKLSDEELSSLLHSASPPVPADWRCEDLLKRIPDLCDELQKPHTTRMILWEEYRKVVPEGYGYTQFCEHLSRFLETRKAVMHFEHQPAASMYFDFAGDKIQLVDRTTGEITKCDVFICTLPFSAYTYVEALPSAKREPLLKALNNAFSFIGGVPLSAKTDNMTQIVKKSNRYEPAFDELAQQWAMHYGTTLMASRVRKPRDKASVESHVNAIYNRIYAPLRNVVFHNLDQLNDALWEELDKFNKRNLQRCDYSRKDRFMLHEKALLLPLPAETFVPKYTVAATVQRNYHVTLGQDWHHYSVPFRYLGKRVQIIYDFDNVEIYLDNVRIACHRRIYSRNGHNTVEEHMPPGHQYYAKTKGWDSEYFIGEASKAGSNTVAVMSKILEQKLYVEQTYNSCLGMLSLGKKYGNDRLEAACQRALVGYKVTYTIVKNILQHNLDKASLQTDLFSIPDHENIRGAESYQ